jgi:hypothetical protein
LYFVPTIADTLSLLVSALALLIPGGVLAAALRLAGLWWLSAAGVFSVAIIGISGVSSSLAGIPFGWWSIAGITLVLSALAVGAHRLVAGSWQRVLSPVVGEWSREFVLVAAVVVVSTIAIISTGFSHIGQFSSFSQTYDAVFHLNAVAFVLDTGDASSFNLYGITHAYGDIDFYPAAWHALVALTSQLSGASIAVSTNASWIAVAGMIWVPGIMLTTSLLSKERRESLFLAVTAGLLASCFAAFPFVLLSWGTLYPTGLAYALIPLGLSIAVAVLIRREDESTTLPNSHRVVMYSSVALWFIGTAFSHPRSFFSAAVLLVPIVAIALIRPIRSAWDDPKRRRRLIVISVSSIVAVAAAGSAAWAFVYVHYGVASRPIADRLGGGPATATHSVWESISHVIFQSPISSATDTVLAPSIVLGLTVLIGAIVAFRSKSTMWLPIGFVIVAVLYVLAAGSNSDFAKIATGIWYKDKYRLYSLIAIVGVPLASFAIFTLWHELRKRQRAVALPVAAVVTTLVVASSWFGPTLREKSMEIGDVFAVTQEKKGRLVDTDQLTLILRLQDDVPEGELIVGNPWNGSPLSWAIGGREALFPHLTGVWSADASIIANKLDYALTDPAVCEAVNRLGVKYVLDDTDFLWGGPPEADYYFGISRAASNSNVLTEVDREGSSALYVITACG